MILSKNPFFISLPVFFIFIDFINASHAFSIIYIVNDVIFLNCHRAEYECGYRRTHTNLQKFRPFAPIFGENPSISSWGNQKYKCHLRTPKYLEA